jgi:hypothetical protein
MLRAQPLFDLRTLEPTRTALAHVRVNVDSVAGSQSPVPILMKQNIFMQEIMIGTPANLNSCDTCTELLL